MQNAFGTSQKSNNPLLYNSRSGNYKTPFGGVHTRETIHIRFPVAEHLCADSVTMFLRRNDHIVKYPLRFSGRRDGYRLFTVNFNLERDGTYYYRFEIVTDTGETVHVGRQGDGQAICGEWLPEWTLTVAESGYSTPDWFKGGIVYHIFCDRFCRKGEAVYPKYGVLKNWDDDVTIVDPDGVYRANDFYGGNFQGIISKLDYLADLGVTTIYLSPIFESSSNHRYDTGDYSKIDSLLGSEDDFKELIVKAKEKGIGIMLDGVFNHTGADSLYFNKFNHYDSVGAYQSKDSQYYDWFTFYEFPNDYHCWWGITVVPTVARDARGFHNLIAGEDGIIKKWTDMGVAGWRLDVVDELSGNFVKNIRERVKRENGKCVLIGEVWEDASTKYSYGEEREYFRGSELDGVMNYVFKDAIMAFLKGGDGAAFAESVMEIIENYPKCSLDSCMTLIDSHDTVRAINVLSGANTDGTDKEYRKNYRLTHEEYHRGKDLLKLAVALQYFLPGVPSVYYGDEIGMQGFEDPINRRPFRWDSIDTEILEHYKYFGKLRKEHRKKFLERAFVAGQGNTVVIQRTSMRLTVNRDTLEIKVDIQ